MVHTIKATDVNNLALRGTNNETLAFRCSHHGSRHEAKTKDLVAGSMSELVHNPAFRSLFPNFLPEASSGAEAQLNIRVTNETLIVEDASHTKTIKFSELNGSNASEQAILTTCQTLIQKVDKVYKKCMREERAHSVAALEADLTRAREAERTTTQWVADTIASQNLIPLSHLQECHRLADNLEVSSGTALPTSFRDYISSLPQPIRDDIFRYLYEIKGNPSSINDWSLGEHYFFEDNYNGVSVTHIDRARAIRLAILKQVASHYAYAAYKTVEQAQELKSFYERLSDKDREHIEMHLWSLHKRPNVELYGNKAFFEYDGYSAKDPQRAEAIMNYVTSLVRS